MRAHPSLPKTFLQPVLAFLHLLYNNNFSIILKKHQFASALQKTLRGRAEKVVVQNRVKKGADISDLGHQNCHTELSGLSLYETRTVDSTPFFMLRSISFSCLTNLPMYLGAFLHRSYTSCYRSNLRIYKSLFYNKLFRS